MKNELDEAGQAAQRINPAIVAINRISRERSAEIHNLLKNDTLRSSALKVLGGQDLRLRVARPEDRLGVLRSLDSLQSIVRSFTPLHDELDRARRKSTKAGITQSKRAQNERILLGDAQLPLREHIRRLVMNRELQSEPALRLWPHFVSLFKTLVSDPEVRDRADNPHEWFIRYEYDPRRWGSMEEAVPPTIRSIGYLRFRTLVRQLRKEVKSPAPD